MSSTKNFTIVATQLVEQLKRDITGDNEDILLGKDPSECIMVGMIDGNYNEQTISEAVDIDNRHFDSVPSIGLRFRTNKSTKKVYITLKGKLFYRIKPTFEQQTTYLVDLFHKTESQEIKDLNSLKEYLKEASKKSDYIERKENLVTVYESIHLKDFGEFELDLNDFEQSLANLNVQLDEILTEISYKIKPNSYSEKNTKRKVSELLDKTMFDSIVKSNLIPCFLRWSIEIFGDYNCYNKYNECILQLVNNTNKSGAKLPYQTAIFNGGLVIRNEEDFLPIEINGSKHYYTDSPYLVALGNNCTVTKNKEGSLETESMPIYIQKRLITIDKYNSNVEFKKLLLDPIKNLNVIYQELLKKLDEYRKELIEVKEQENPKYIKCFSKEIDQFEQEIIRYKRGIDLLNNKPMVRHAFDLMNETFSLNEYKGWRMFQIVFIVSELSDMVYCEYKDDKTFICDSIDNVDLIYFPTGGGKTETFLGCCIFSAFFDRLRGKQNGMTALIKYPLRLLAAQQLDRVLDLSIKANRIKEKYNIGGDPLSVGFYSGSKNTPNKIDVKKKTEIESMTQETKNDLYRQIDVCPKCGRQMNVYFDQNTWTLKHKCSGCGFEPLIYIVDDEIYRFAPTFVISTIDKMANIGTSLGFKALFGQSTGKCPKHGFIFNGTKCNVPTCKEISETVIHRKDPVPTLDIQDEMHLVNESLGTFDSHYESLIQYYCEKLLPDKSQRKKIKFIGATATISNYEQHIKNLYNKNALMFPTSVRKQNFYSEIDENDVSRIIIGSALYGGSIVNCIQRIVTFMRIIVSKWYANPSLILEQLKQKGFDGDAEKLKTILQYYLIQIIYNNSKNDGGKVRASIENQGNNMLAGENMPLFNVAEITGDVDFKQIKNVMHEIRAEDDKYKTKNTIIATSAISHGVDEKYFNQIYFFGMPNETSEYIQAYSRVGRTYTGLVFDIFRVFRDRDKSFLKNYYNFHEYKELLIDPVPINRYAKNAIYSTLPGIISALLMQHYVKQYNARSVTFAINHGQLSLEDLTNDVLTIYDCKGNDSKLYQEIIVNEVKKIYSAFKNNLRTDLSISDLLRKSSSRGKGPMTNLRDVEIALDLEMKEG